MKKIYLTGKYGKGKYTLVDDENYEWLNQWKWYRTELGYVSRTNNVRRSTLPKKIQMHTLILNPPAGLEPDHINRNKLDNRRANLRVVTRSQNMWNRGLDQNNNSGYRGVVWNKRANRWIATIGVHGERIYLGAFKIKEEAALAFKQAVVEYHV
jgi:hypothetical protein